MRKEGSSSYFYRIAELKGPLGSGIASFGSQGCFSGHTNAGIVILKAEKERNRFEAHYAKRTPTWLVSRYKIERLIEEIDQETKRTIPFNIFGNKSVFSKYVECFDIYDPMIYYISNFNRNLFLRLFDSAVNGGEYTGMNARAFNKEITQVFKEISKMTILDKIPSYHELIEIFKKSTTMTKQPENSCFTWARHKLTTLGIILQDRAIERLISITTLYATYEPGEIVTTTSIVKKSTIKRIQPKLFHEKVSFYDDNRDKRTEEWKSLELKSKVNHFFYKAASYTSLGCGLGFGMTIQFAPIFPPITASITGSLGLLGLIGKGLSAFISSRQNALCEYVARNPHLDQPGNRYACLPIIDTPFFDKNSRQYFAEYKRVHDRLDAIYASEKNQPKLLDAPNFSTSSSGHLDSSRSSEDLSSSSTSGGSEEIEEMKSDSVSTESSSEEVLSQLANQRTSSDSESSSSLDNDQPEQVSSKKLSSSSSSEEILVPPQKLIKNQRPLDSEKQTSQRPTQRVEIKNPEGESPPGIEDKS